MPICLDKADGRVRAMVSGVETKTRNGYEIIWNLLFRYVPGFDPTKTVDKPRWDTYKGNVIQYAAAFDLYFRLIAKRGNTHSQFNKSILFLKGITALNLTKIVEPLIIAIECMQSDEDTSEGRFPIGYLPYHLCVYKLAQKIADRCKVEPFDTPTDTTIPTRGLFDSGANLCMTNNPNLLVDVRPCPPFTISLATTCDFLAMSVFLQRYLKNGIATKDTIAAAESRWIDRWKDNCGTPTTTPSKVYPMYAANSGLMLEQMEDKMDWLCWPTIPAE
jgi:hypothetical protein